ncbi:adenosine kinase [Dysgonomonas sp. 216]|uniref:adenosine kinase n=1 Tax=Dysgonomonas sp. 216 TaxID=2302934 RepID=UPI0013D6316B|nr:adenosine kinase [Dysgonomonas sp. 216]NDW17648.1 adenosine kinase [Dysgonomonas sp. 216]
MKILGMGNALIDVLAVINDDSLLEQMNLPKGSMQLIDEQTMKSLSDALVNFKKHLASGGSASNTITGLGKLGIGSGFIGKVGKDFYGNYFKEDLTKYGVKSHLTETNEASGVATTFISKDGERTFGTFLGAAANLTPADIDPKNFEGYSYFYIEGYLVQNLELIRKSIVTAKEAGLKVILDLASYNVVEANLDFLLEIMPKYVDIVFANEEEAKSLLNLDPEAAVSELAKMVDIAIVKTGAKGSWIQQADQKVFVPALSVNCVDTTGAGDLYAAGFLYGLVKGYSLKTSGEIGTLLAANVIQLIGAKIDEERWDKIFENLKSLS